jgi:hypothetical protein
VRQLFGSFQRMATAWTSMRSPTLGVRREQQANSRIKKISSEKRFYPTKVGWTCFVTWVVQFDKAKWWYNGPPAEQCVKAIYGWRLNWGDRFQSSEAKWFYIMAVPSGYSRVRWRPCNRSW